MWRPFLTRGSHPLLRRPAGCGAGGQTVAAAVLGSANARAYASEVDGAKTRPRPQRHLFVVLDEMNTGHSIYKLNIDDLDGGDEDAVAGKGRAAHQATPQQPRRLPDPVLRLGFSSVGSCAHFEALGSKIVVTGRARHNNSSVTYIYHTETARLDLEQPPLDDFMYWHYHAAAAGDKLYTFSSHKSLPHYLCEQRALREYSDSGYDSGEERMTYGMRGQINEWAWKTSPSPLPGSSHNAASFVRSYAVHPDDRTIFVSCCFAGGNYKSFTYSLDTNNGESTRRGDWVLPFDGQAYYDGHLGAWVGIREADGTEGGKKGCFYLYSCDIPDLAPKPLSAPLEWKMCKEELTFVEDVSVQALVHTGRGRFCLVETTPAPLTEEAEDSRCTCGNGGLEYLLQVTMFCAKHDKNGELVISRSRPSRSYLVPNYAADSLSAFWM